MGLYRKDNSPYWWGTFKLPGMDKPHYFSTKQTKKALAQQVFDKERESWSKRVLLGERQETTQHHKAAHPSHADLPGAKQWLRDQWKGQKRQ